MNKDTKTTGGGRSGPYHHGDLKAALIAVARDMLERDGPEALSLRAVAQGAGVSRTAPYNHFADKEALLAALAEDGFRVITAAQIEASVAPQSVDARLVALGKAYVAFALTHPQLYRLMYGVGVSGWCRHPAVTERKQASFEPVQTALATYLDANTDLKEMRLAAVSAWAQVHGLSMLLLDGSLGVDLDAAGTADALVGQILANFVAGLKHHGTVNAG